MVKILSKLAFTICDTMCPQALGYTLWFSLFSLKLNIFPFSASILTFSKIETLKGKIFNSNENNENHKVYPSALW